MAHFPSARLSRQELYSYGFKEGQSWGEDRRTLESALNAMDQLESEIEHNYIYGRPAPGGSNPYSPSAATPRHATAAPAGYFTPANSMRYSTPNICMARSDGSSEFSDISSYSGRGCEYEADSYRDPMIYGSAQSGWNQASPSTYHRSPDNGSAFPPNFQLYPGQYFEPSPPPPPPSRISPSSSYRNYRSVEDPASYSPAALYYGSRGSNMSRSSSSVATGPAQPLSPSQMQLVGYNNGQPPVDVDAPEEQHYATSPQWSMDATQGTAASDRSMSGYSEESAFSDVTRSSGYVESYDVASYGDYRSDYHHDSEDEHDYMSDDVASNEGEYYSSGEEPDYEGDGEDVYSDGGYSDSYDDGSYASE